MKVSQTAMICGLFVVILGSSVSANATLTPIGPFKGLWSESFDSMPPDGSIPNGLVASIMGGNATIYMANIPFGDPFSIEDKLVATTHSGYMVLDFITPVDAFGAYMRVLDYRIVEPFNPMEYVRFFDSGKNVVGEAVVSSTPLPGCLGPFEPCAEAPLSWYGYESSVPFQFVQFGGTEAFWLIMDDLQAGRPIPEPSTWLLLASSLIGFAGYGRKKLFKK